MRPPPRNLTIGITDVCNLKCVMCYHAINGPEYFDHATWEPKKVHGFFLKAKHVALHGCGEPLAHPRFWEFLPSKISKRNHVGFCTNGLLFDAENVEHLFQKNIAWIDFSIDAGSPETYRRIRGGDWHRLWENIDLIFQKRRSGKYPELYANMVLIQENLWEIPWLIPQLATRGFAHLHIFHANQVREPWSVPFHGGSGEVFDYLEQDPFRKPDHDHAIQEAIRCARNWNFTLLASGEFLGRTLDHQSLN